MRTQILFVFELTHDFITDLSVLLTFYFLLLTTKVISILCFLL